MRSLFILKHLKTALPGIYILNPFNNILYRLYITYTSWWLHGMLIFCACSECRRYGHQNSKGRLRVVAWLISDKQEFRFVRIQLHIHTTFIFSKMHFYVCGQLVILHSSKTRYSESNKIEHIFGMFLCSINS